MAGRRKNGAGTIRKRKDGRWEGRVVVSYKENGDPVTKNVLAKTRTECQNKLNELIEKTLPPSKKLAPDMPFGVWIDFWYQNYVKPGVRESTRDAYENNIYNHIIPELGKIPLNQLSESDLQQFYSKMLKSGRVIRVEQYGEGLSASIVRKMHVLCGAALEKAIESGFLRKNPNVGCKLPPKRGPMMQILSIEEMQRFLIQAKYDGLYELYLLELSTGLRLGELLALQWKDINFKTGALHVSKQLTTVHGKATISEPKTPASIRTVYLSKPVLEVLRAYGKSVDSDWMFPSQRRNLPLHPSAIRKRLKGTLERAECKNVRFHDLRHPYVKHTTKIFSLRLMDFQAQAYPDARRKTCGACQLHLGGQSRSLVRPLGNRKQFSCLPPQSKMSWILYAISMRLSGYTSTLSISSSASSVVSASASKIALDASLRLSCRTCSSCFCFACANTAA